MTDEILRLKLGILLTSSKYNRVYDIRKTAISISNLSITEKSERNTIG